MLSDAEIDGAARELADFRRDDVLSRVLTRYGELLEDYRRLKSDYEEERESRERYKKLAKEQDRNPYVVVLVDGDGYVFQDLVGQKGAADDSGANAARALNEAVRLSLQSRGLDHCQIIVRVYADVAGLSKALAKAGLCGPEKRSLAPFIASFNRCFGHTDFVDAGDLKENADFKLRAMLRLHADNAQCKHIYFAACHDVGYISELTPHKGDRARFTLVNTPSVGFHPQFTRLDMGIESFTGVFRSTPLNLAMQKPQPLQRAPSAASVPAPPPAAKPAAAASSTATAVDADPRTLSPGDDSGGTNKEICKFFPLGKCKFGNSCKNTHANDRLSSVTSWRSASRGATQPDSRRSNGWDPDAEESPASSRHTLHQKKVMQHKHEERLVDEGGGGGEGHPSAPIYLHLDDLPKKEIIPSGFIAVNENKFRLDAFIPPVSRVVQAELRSRIKTRPVCNEWHLAGHCRRGPDCPYDHETLSPSAKRALEFLARSIKCPAAGECRNQNCTKGHVCQNQQCKHNGGKDFCRLPYGSHRQALRVAQYLPADAPSQSSYNDKSLDRMSPSNGDVDYEDLDEEEEEQEEAQHFQNNGGRSPMLFAFGRKQPPASASEAVHDA